MQNLTMRYEYTSAYTKLIGSAEFVVGTSGLNSGVFFSVESNISNRHNRQNISAARTDPATTSKNKTAIAKTFRIKFMFPSLK